MGTVSGSGSNQLAAGSATLGEGLTTIGDGTNTLTSSLKDASKKSNIKSQARHINRCLLQ